jgi:CHAD domain-containing protein
LLRDPIVARIWRTLRSIDEAPPEPGETPVSHPISGMTELALEEYRAFVQRHGSISAENLHDYRLECKRFRYTAELAGETADAIQLTKIWKETQDVIGEWHDYLTLTAVARKEGADSSVQSALASITEQKFAAAQKVIEASERKLTGKRGSIPKKKPLRAQRLHAVDAA